MREAMANAEVGDDVFGDDPTVNKLQQKCAEITGKEAALFVPSGCMANQLAIKAQTQPSDEIIVEADSHIIKYENASPSFISGVQVMPVKGDNGVLDRDEVKRNIRLPWYHFPRTALICLENTHNRACGAVYPYQEMLKISELAKENSIKIHLDGARIFNASVETGISLMEYSSLFDSISFCFSKGLGAPVGSVLCSDGMTIGYAHRIRKVLGGGMRQAGIIAAGALYALEHNIVRLKEDHKNARLFAGKISEIDSVEIDSRTVQTNIVVFKVKKDADYIRERLGEKGVLVTNEGKERMRAVFHLDISESDTYNALEIFKQILN
jgi:threonine aldolase